MRHQQYSYTPKQLAAEDFHAEAEKAHFHRDILDEVFAGYPRKDMFAATTRGYIEKELHFYADVWAFNVHQLYVGFSTSLFNFLEREATERVKDGRSSVPFTGEERNLKPIERAVRSVTREYVFAPLFELLNNNTIQSGTKMHCSFSGLDKLGNPTYWLYSHEHRDRQGDFFSRIELRVDISSREAFDASVNKQKEEAQQRRLRSYGG